MMARLISWLRGAPYTLHWGTYPQVGRLHTRREGGFVDRENAAAAAYQRGAHWYQVRDRYGREVWSSDHDIEALRANPPQITFNEGE